MYAGVELFLKARLLAEHWTLVIAKPQEADLAKFLKGDFQSVTLDDAAKRLDKIVRSGLTPTEVEQVRSLGRHRNQMMHFYHDNTGPAGEALRREVAVEQLRTCTPRTGWCSVVRTMCSSLGRNESAGSTKRLRDIETICRFASMH